MLIPGIVAQVPISPIVITSGAAFIVDEGTTAVGTITATPSDHPAGALAFSIGGTDAALFAIDSATGALEFLSAPSYASPGDDGADNIYDLTVAVADGGQTVEQAITVTVVAIAAAADPDFATNVLVLNMDGVDPGSPSSGPVDYSPSAFVMSASGTGAAGDYDATVGPFGAGSWLMADASAGGRVFAPDDPSFQAAGEFCWELFFLPELAEASTRRGLINKYATTPNYSFQIDCQVNTTAATSNLRFMFHTTNVPTPTHELSATVTINPAEWNYVRVTRDAAGTMRMHHGILGGAAAMVASKTSATGTNYDSPTVVEIGGGGFGCSDFRGHIGPTRMNNGSSRGTTDADVTVPTEAFPTAA